MPGLQRIGEVMMPETTEPSWDALHDRYLGLLGGERHVWGTTPT